MLMRQAGFYAQVITAISLQQRQMVGFAFVDDMDLCVAGPHVTENNVVQQMQALVTQWEGTLRATGGALVPEKCFWYLLDYRYIGDKWQLATKAQHHGEITVHNSDGRLLTIPRLETSEACRTLGMKLAPDGNWDEEVNYLISVMTTWQTRMMVLRLNQHDATFSLRNVILRKILYPLATTTFSKDQCNRIMWPLLQTGLAKGGIVRTLPRALVHGPLQYGGLDLPDLHTEQTVMHLKMLLRFGNDGNHPTGFLLQATAEALRLELGYNGELFSAPAELSANLTDSWITHLWRTMHESHLMVLSDFTSPPPGRVNDVELMRLFIDSGQRQPHLKLLNECQMFLQAFYLSDIVDATGSRIQGSCWEVQHPCSLELN